jgi:hypothetical protein
VARRSTRRRQDVGAGRRLLRVLSWWLLALVLVGVGALVVADKWAREEGKVWVIEIPFEVGDRQAVTTGRIVFIHHGDADSASLLAHELVHVCQWEDGRRQFLWDYTSEYASNLARLRDHELAYTEISFEHQARDGEIDCDIENYQLERVLVDAVKP